MIRKGDTFWSEAEREKMRADRHRLRMELGTFYPGAIRHHSEVPRAESAEWRPWWRECRRLDRYTESVIVEAVQDGIRAGRIKIDNTETWLRATKNKD